jgi:catechol 2,3-dioxygenase-like lactoylglutathione lyase family enzyme
MIKTVRCITFYVSDLEKSTKFYEETLGLEKKYLYKSYVGFDCGGVEIGLIRVPEKEDAVSVPSCSVEFLVDDVNVFYRELKNKGVSFVEELHDEIWGGRQATFRDPDGNMLEIVQMNWQRYFSVSAQGAKKSRGLP